MMRRYISVLAVTMGCWVISASATAGALETNLSGWFVKGDRAEIAVTGLRSSGFNFRLSAGNITPEQGCVNGPAGCLTLWGWATPTATPGEYLYANENGQCAFTIQNEAKAIVVRGLSGTCGANEMNHNALRWIEGVYGQVQ